LIADDSYRLITIHDVPRGTSDVTLVMDSYIIGVLLYRSPCAGAGGASFIMRECDFAVFHRISAMGQIPRVQAYRPTKSLVK